MNQPWVYMCSPSWTPRPPPSPSHPSGSSQCTSPEHPVSYIKPELTIYFTYSNIHVSMLFFQIIPPSPSPTESKSVLYINVCLVIWPWTLFEKTRMGWFERIALKHVYYHMSNRSPVQVWCMRQGAQGWCTGMTLTDGMGKEEGEGFRMGNTCTPVVDSCWCMAKPIQYWEQLASN